MKKNNETEQHQYVGLNCTLINTANRINGFWDERDAILDSEKLYPENPLKKFNKSAMISQLLLLIISEATEANEALRKSKMADLSSYDARHKELVESINPNLDQASAIKNAENIFKSLFENYVKDSFEDEIADVFIRLADLVGGLGINIQKHIELKLKYNSLRTYKHGKSF